MKTRSVTDRTTELGETVNFRFVGMYLTAIYQHLLSDRKFGLTHNLLATKVMPTLIPLTVAPGLNIDQASGPQSF